MTKTLSRFSLSAASISLIAAAGIAAAPAHAAGTPAGTVLTTNGTLTFDVTGIAQTPISTQNVRPVDRVIDVTLDVLTTQPVTVAPQQTNVMSKLRVTNLSNDAISLIPYGQEYDSPQSGFPSNFYRFYRDTNGNGQYDEGVDQQIGQNGVDGNGAEIFPPLTASGASETWFAFADIPAEAATLNGQTVNHGVYTGSQYFDTATQQLEWIYDNTYEDEADIDTYFADQAGPDDSISDGVISVTLNYLIAAASLSVTRSSQVISDLINGTNNPKAIPGALVEYCLAVTNAPGGATATDVVVTDTVSSDLEIDQGFAIKLNGTVSGATCNSDGIGGGVINGSIISGTIPTLAGGETKTVIYRATVK